MLLEYGADVNITDKRGLNALDFAKANFANLPQNDVEILIALVTPNKT